MENKWKKLGKIFSSNQFDFLNQFTHTQCPTYLKVHDKHRVYFSSRDQNNKSMIFFVTLSFENETLFISDNKLNGPILIQGKSKEFDSDGVMPSYFYQRDTDLILYYTGWKLSNKYPYENSIGIAISKDYGNTFRKYNHNPVIKKDKINTFFTGTSCVLKINDKYINYYMSCYDWINDKKNNTLEPIYDLKIATSNDGINWECSGKTAIKLMPGWGGISKASILKIGDFFHMWFSYRKITDYRYNKKKSYKIGYAKSKDGFQWKLDDIIFEEPDQSENGDQTMQAYPNVFEINKNIFMLYNGNEFGKTGVFLARMIA